MIDFRYRGFTLVELMVVLSIAAIVGAFSVSSFSALVHSTQSRTATRDLRQGLMYARVLAVKHNVLVTVCPLDSDGTCNTDWSQPVSIFEDPNHNHRHDAGESVRRIIQAPGSGRLTVAVGNHHYFQFNPTGTSHGTWGNITYCPNDGSASDATRLIINWGGRVREAKDQDGDGIIEDSAGDPVTCG